MDQVVENSKNGTKIGDAPPGSKRALRESGIALQSTELYWASVKSKRQLTVPEPVFASLGIAEGQVVSLVKAGDGFWVLTSKSIPINQSVSEFLRGNLVVLDVVDCTETLKSGTSREG